jgi:hypothetical protein
MSHEAMGALIVVLGMGIGGWGTFALFDWRDRRAQQRQQDRGVSA